MVIAWEQVFYFLVCKLRRYNVDRIGSVTSSTRKWWLLGFSVVTRKMILPSALGKWLVAAGTETIFQDKSEGLAYLEAMTRSCSSGLGSRWSMGSSSPDPHSDSSSGVNVTLLAIRIDASGSAVTSPTASFDVHFRNCSTTDGWKFINWVTVN